jgi:hypothetical protein
MLWALECFFSAVILVITVLGGKEGGSQYLRRTNIPHLKPENRDLFNISRGEGEKGWSQRGFGVGIGIGMGEPTISARSTRKFVLVQREG